jgi:hypothetical protein
MQIVGRANQLAMQANQNTSVGIMLHLRMVEVAQELLERDIAIRSFLKKRHGFEGKHRVGVPRRIRANVSLKKAR